MTKGTPSFGKKARKDLHVRCRRCGHSSFHVRKKRCSFCGYPDKKWRKYSWQTKVNGRRKI
jgi:large subunit ribosomal protein L37e